MPRPYPREFRDDVVAVARRREPGVTLKQIAEEFGIAEASLTNWLKQADIDDGKRPGATESDQAETRQDLRLAIVVWIERKYHRQRAQDTLNGLTPIEYEAKLATPRELAA